MVGRRYFVSSDDADRAAVAGFLAEFGITADTCVSRPRDGSAEVDLRADAIGHIRREWIRDASVTLVLVGECTWARRIVDWEVMASLIQPPSGMPVGLLAVLLERGTARGRLPERVQLNVESGYALFMPRPVSAEELADWLEQAHESRTTRAHLIRNPVERMPRDSPCG